MSDTAGKPSHEWLLSLNAALARLEATTLANREASAENLRTLQQGIRREVEWVLTHFDQRFSDLKDEVFHRFERTDARQDRLERSLATPHQPVEVDEHLKTLTAISRVASLVRGLPWKGTLLTLGWLLAVLTHWLPAEINLWLQKLRVLGALP